MKKYTPLSILAAGVLFATAGSARADDANWTIGLKGGTQGVGIEVSHALNSALALRVSGSFFDFNHTATKDGVKYDFDLDLKTASALLDWHVLHGNFRLSGGLVYNKNKVDALGVSTGSVQIGDVTYSQEELGTLTGQISVNDFAPYAGLGWGKTLGKSGWGLSVDAGVMFQGTPRVKLEATGGLLSNDAEFLSELQKEESNLRDDIEDYKYYPVVSIGLSYSF